MIRFLHICLALLAAFSILVEVERAAIFAIWSNVDNDSFTKHYCINIEHPELDCAGSCRISSELSALKDLSNQPVQMTKLAAQEITYYVHSSVIENTISNDLIDEQDAFFPLESLYFYQFTSSVFRPPGFSFA